MTVKGTIHALLNPVDYIRQTRQIESQFAIQDKEHTLRREISERQEAIQLLSLEMALIRQERDHANMKEIAQLNRDHQQLLANTAKEVQIRVNQDNLAFQAWRFERERELQYDLDERRQELQAKIAAFHRETSLANLRASKKYEYFPLRLIADDILSNREDPEQMLIFVSPYKVEFDRSTSASSALPDIEKTIAQNIRDFLDSYDPHHNTVRFLGGAWKSKEFHSETSVLEVFSVLNSQPVLILETETEGEHLNFRVGYWGRNWSSYRYHTIISKLSYRNILERSARRCALQCETENQNQLHEIDNWSDDLGAKQEVLRTGGDDEHNMQIIADTHPGQNFNFSNSHWEELCDIISAYHCLMIGVVADTYFLSYHNRTPVLPRLFRKLIEGIRDSEVRADISERFLTYCRDLYDAYKKEHMALAPDLALDLAIGLAALQEQETAKSFIRESFRSWLFLHGIDHDEITAPLSVLRPRLNSSDQLYLTKLAGCWDQLGDKDMAQQIGTSADLPAGPFRNTKTSVDSFVTDWRDTGGKTIEKIEAAYGGSNVGEAYKLKRRNEFNNHLNSVEKAQQVLYQSLQTPHLIISAVGTTSSGKSTLLNFLCNAEVMPTAVGERSAGAVFLLPTTEGERSRLVLRQLMNARVDYGHTWQQFLNDELYHEALNGLDIDWARLERENIEWSNLTANEIRIRLEAVMTLYHLAVNHLTSNDKSSDRDVEAPVFELQYPAPLIAGLVNDAALPLGSRVSLLDLPGLKFVGDEKNKKVIQEHIRNSLCVALYDAHETDPSRQAALIDELVEKIKELANSDPSVAAELALARILIIFNKIDVFNRERNIETEKSRFVAQKTREIKDAIRRKINQHADFVDQLTFLKFSAHPALLAERLRTAPTFEEKASITDDIYDHYRTLLPKERRYEFPKTEAEFDNIASSVYRAAHAEEFVNTLMTHVRTHFPKLVIPQMVYQFQESAASEAERWLLQVANTEADACIKTFEERRKELEQQRMELQDMHQESAKKMREPFEAIAGLLDQEGHDIETLALEVTAQTDKFMNIPISPKLANSKLVDILGQNALAPLRNVTKEWLEVADFVLENINNALNGNFNDRALEKYLTKSECNRLYQAITRFSAAGYTEAAAKKGYKKATTKTSEIEALKSLKRGFQDLQIEVKNALEIAAQEMFKILEQQVYDATGRFLGAAVQILSQEAASIVPGVGLDVTLPSLSHVQSERIELVYTLNQDFQITSRMVEQFSHYRTKGLGVARWFGELFDTDWGRESVFENVEEKSLSIPKATDIAQTWMFQIHETVPSILKQVNAWVLRQLDQCIMQISEFQNEVIEQYLAKLDEVDRAQADIYQRDHQYWEEVQGKVNSIKSRLEAIHSATRVTELLAA